MVDIKETFISEKGIDYLCVCVHLKMLLNLVNTESLKNFGILQFKIAWGVIVNQKNFQNLKVIGDGCL